jgi:hypothetical protein
MFICEVFREGRVVVEGKPFELASNPNFIRGRCINRLMKVVLVDTIIF